MEPLEPWRVWTQAGVVLGAIALAAARPLPVLRVVAAGMAVMIGYGAVQDQFSARLCPEYFTVAHPPIPGVTDPTLLRLAWGLLGGWWGGLFLGLGMAAAARFGPRPPAPAADIARAYAGLACGVGFASAAAGLAAWHAAGVLGVSVGEPWATLVPPAHHRGLVAVTVTHVVTYATAVAGGVAACAWVGLRRPAG